MKSLSKTNFLVLWLSLFFTLSQCTTSLAPQFDELIFQQLSTNSEEVLTFFASVEKGTESDSFMKRESKYNELIGQFEALELKTRARPIPSNSILERVNKSLQFRGMTEISGDYPSAHAMGKIAETLKVMKKNDEKEGLGDVTVKAFKNQVLIYLDQALTYENFLNR